MDYFSTSKSLTELDAGADSVEPHKVMLRVILQQKPQSVYL